MYIIYTYRWAQRAYYSVLRLLCIGQQIASICIRVICIRVCPPIRYLHMEYSLNVISCRCPRSGINSTNKRPPWISYKSSSFKLTNAQISYWPNWLGINYTPRRHTHTTELFIVQFHNCDQMPNRICSPQNKIY